MNTQIIKPIIAVWLVLTTSSLQAWQGGETAGGNTVESPATTPLDPFSFSPDAPGVLSKQVQTGRVVQGGSVMITWSENNDELRGFSNTLGEWETFKIAKQDSIIPIVANDVAAVRIGDSIAAFSGVNGWWDVIPLSKDSAARPTVSNDLVQVEDNGHLYTFAAAKGRWTSPTDSDLQSASLELRPHNGLKPQDRQKLDEWLKSLPRYKARGITFNFTSALPYRAGRVGIHTARRSWLKESEDKLNEIAAQPDPKTSSEAATSESSGPGDAAGLESRIASLREKLRSLDGDVNSGANDADQDARTREVRKQALRKSVEKSFDLRQDLQRLEAQRMQRKLELIEANLDARDKNREDIIQHRVNELLDSNGELTKRGAGDKTTPRANPETPTTGTPIGLPGPPHLPYGGPAGLESQTVRNSDAGIQWPQPAEIVKDLRSKERSVEGTLSVRKMLQEHVKQWSKPLEQLQSEGIADLEMTEAERQSKVDTTSETVRQAQSSLDTGHRDWNRAWSAYQSKLHLLRLDVEEAKLTLEPLQENHDQLKRLVERSAVSVGEVTQAASDLAIAKINVQRAEELLKLYADIETTEPELNPDSLNSKK
jgi:hypothetical protein